jgi:hypothetical protein
VRIVRDDSRHPYTGQTAAKVRNLRGQSMRMAIKTGDGKVWHWPMEWLALMASASGSGESSDGTGQVHEVTQRV